MSGPRHRREINTGLGNACVPATVVLGTVVTEDSCNAISYCNTDNILDPHCKLTWWFILIIVVIAVIVIGLVMSCSYVIYVLYACAQGGS